MEKQQRTSETHLDDVIPCNTLSAAPTCPQNGPKYSVVRERDSNLCVHAGHDKERLLQGEESRLRDEDEDESSRPGAVNVQLRYAATAEYYG